MCIRDRDRRLDLVVLAEILGLDTLHSLRDSKLIWIDAAIKQNQLDRSPIWTETVAVGNKEYVGYMHRSLKTLQLMVMRNWSTDSPWLASNNPNARFNQPELDDCNLHLPLWQLTRASAAAPAYYVPETITLSLIHI